MDIKMRLEELRKIISEAKEEYYSLIKSEMDKFKGKFYEDKTEDPVKISILYVLNSNWDNVIEYRRCFYCKDKRGDWWKLDEKLSYEIDLYGLSKLQECKEITEDEYISLRKEIAQRIHDSSVEQADRVLKEYNNSIKKEGQ